LIRQSPRWASINPLSARATALARFRTILFHKRNERAVFLYMFPKNVRANVTTGELDAVAERVA
jgi:hypothetical protein